MVETLEKLYDIRETFDLVLENVNDLICIVDPNENYKIEMINQRVFQETLGYSRNELIGRSFLELIIKGDRIDPSSIVKNALLDEEKSNEIKLKKKDGDCIFVEIKGKQAKTINAQERLFLILKDITHIKIKEKEFRDAELKFELISNYSNDFYAILNDKFEYEYINERVYKENLGFEKDEIVGKTSLNLIYPDDVQKAMRGLRKGFDKGENSADIRIRTKNDGYVWVETKGRTYTDNDGNIKALLTGRDITARKEAEQKLKESEEKYRFITENINDIISLLDENFKLKFINETQERISGFSEEEVMGKTPMEFLHPDDFKRAAMILKKTIKEGEGRGEFRMRAKDNSYQWMSVNGRVSYDSEGNQMILLVSRDITREKQAEQKLHESEEMFRTIAEQSMMGIVILQDGQVKYINETLASIYGYEDDDSIYQWQPGEFLKAIHPDYRKIVAEQIRKKTSGQEDSLTHYSIKIVKKSGEIAWIENYSKPIIFEGRSAILGIQIDITKKVMVEEQLKESEEKYKVISETAYDLIGILNKSFKYEYLNEQAFQQTLGYSKEEVIGKSVLMYLHPDDVNHTAKALFEGFKHSKGGALFRFKHKDNYWLWLEAKGKTFIDKDGNTKALIISRDVNERKEAEQKLKDSEERYRILFEKSPIGITTSNKDNEIVLMNDKIEEITGYSKEELNIINLESIYIDIKQHSEIFEIMATNGMIHNYEVKIRHKNGTEKTCLLNVDKLKISGTSFFQTTLQDITMRKESEEKFKTIADQSMMGIVIFQDGIIKYANQQLVNIHGGSIEDLYKLKPGEFLKYIHPDYRNVVIQNLREKESGQKSITSQYPIKIINDKGQIAWIENFSKSIMFEGRPAILGMEVDISDKLLMEQSLKESEEKFRTIAEQSMMGICIVQDNHVKYTNKIFPEIWGYSTEEILNWTVEEFQKTFHPEDREFILDQLRKKQEGRSDIELNYRYRGIKKNGEIIWIENFSKAILFQGKPADLITAIDISERIKAENRLKESEKVYREREKNLIDIIIEMNVDGRINYISHQVSDVLGYKGEELIGTNGYDLSHPDDIEQIQLLTEESYKQNKPIYFEFRAKHKDGYYIPMSAHGNIVFVDEIPKIVGIVKDESEKKEAESKLKESEEKYRHIAEQSLMGIVIMQDNLFKYANEGFSIITEYSIEEVMKWTMEDWGKTVHPEDLQILIDRLKKRAEGIKNIPQFELFRIITKSGKIKWIESYGKELQLNGRIATYAALMDVTEKMEAEKKIKESEEKYRNLFDTSPNAIILMDKKGLIIDCNLTTKLMLGYTKEDLIGENYLKLQAFSPTIKPLERIKVMDPKKTIHRQLELQVKKKDGSPAWITAQTSNIKIGDKKLMQVIIQDITEKRNYEELISELNMNFLTFTADVQNNIHLLLNTCCSLMNGELALFVHKTTRERKEQYEVITSDKRMFTYDAVDFEKAIHVSEFFKEEHDNSQVLQNINDTPYAKTDHFIINHNIKGCYGKLIRLKDYYDGLLCILYDTNPTITHQDDLVMFLICDAIEIEQRRWEAREQLEAQNEALSEISKLKSDLLSRTSHELKTPLISIKGFTELLLTRHGYKLDSDVISLLDEIKDGSTRLERIIHSLLQSSKLEQDKVILTSSQDNLSFLIKFCVKEVQSLATLRDQKISIDIKDNIIVSFDKERLYDVLINLLSNAIKNTPSQGEIFVFAEEKDDSFVISVKDSGVGITEDEKKKLFKKFGKIERYGQSWDINIEGTGLGLYIAKKIVKLHGGNIWVESEGRNKGSTFSFSIPKT